jgi:hypothetical protein
MKEISNMFRGAVKAKKDEVEQGTCVWHDLRLVATKRGGSDEKLQRATTAQSPIVAGRDRLAGSSIGRESERGWDLCRFMSHRIALHRKVARAGRAMR